MKIEDVDYRDGSLPMQGYLAYDETAKGRRPGVLLVHEAWGLGEGVQRRARMLAELGYVAFAADMFGARKQYDNLPEVIPVLTDLKSNPPKIRGRASAALDVLKSLPNVDPSRLFAIGYCFGGSTVLELARAGAPLLGVVSFHGDLSTAAPAKSGEVKASVLALTGADDPMVPPAQRDAFEEEMRQAGIDWQLTAYGRTVHGFTNPAADGSVSPAVFYQADSDRRSWLAMQNFFNDRLQAGK